MKSKSLEELKIVCRNTNTFLLKRMTNGNYYNFKRDLGFFTEWDVWRIFGTRCEMKRSRAQLKWQGNIVPRARLRYNFYPEKENDSVIKIVPYDFRYPTKRQITDNHYVVSGHVKVDVKKARFCFDKVYGSLEMFITYSCHSFEYDGGKWPEDGIFCF